MINSWSSSQRMSSVFSFQLRYLQTLNSISAENNSTVIFPVPIDIMSQLMNRPQQQQQFPMFMPQQQPLQPQQTGPQAQQQQQQGGGGGGQQQSYPRSSLKKAPPAPIHSGHHQLGQRAEARRSVRKSKVRKNNWCGVMLIDPDRRFARLVYLKCFIHERKYYFCQTQRIKPGVRPRGSDF